MKSRTLRICFISTLTPLHCPSQVGMYLDILCGELSRRGNNVTVITTSVSDTEKHHHTIQQTNTANYHILANTKCGIFDARFHRKTTELINKIIHTENFNLIHSINQSVNLTDITRIPQITTLITPSSKIITKQLKKAVAYADKIIVLSRYMQRLLGYCFPAISTTQCIYGSVCNSNAEPEQIYADSSLKDNYSKPNKTIILSIHTQHTPQNWKMIVSVWSKIDNPSTQLVILSHKKDIKKIRKYIERHNQSMQNITVAEHSKLSLLHYQAIAKGCIFNPQTASDWSYDLLEMLNRSIPVIGARLGCIPELVGDAGLLFSPQNEHDLYDQLDYFIDHIDSRQIMSKKAKTRVDCFFSADKMIKQILMLYFMCIKENKRAK